MNRIVPTGLWPSDDRLGLMRAGIKDLKLWLDDIVRVGLIIHQLPDVELDTMSSRLVDSQLGGLARKLRLLKTLDRNEPAWPKITLAVLSRLYLVADYFHKWDMLNQVQKFTLLMHCGLHVRKEQLSTISGTRDFWTVLGISHLQEENLVMRRVWIAGSRSKKIGLLLDFKHRTGNFTSFWEMNKTYAGELVYYPSSFPLRAILKDCSQVQSEEKQFPAYKSLDTFMNNYALAVSRDNWLSVFPAPLKDVYLDYVDGSFRLIDKQKKYLPVEMDDGGCWSLVGRSHCEPLQCMAEWDGSSLNILAYKVDQKIFPTRDLI